MRIHEVINDEIIPCSKDIVFTNVDGIRSGGFENGDGLRITSKSRSFELECCGCGLSHTIIIIHQNDSIILRFVDEDHDYKDYIER